ncbi:hypothetical protein LGK97_06460 [Clostridium sp. CS001]|uniref:hypothetical protein n=1 Tax=Clostridium sp. CS001 TaxID=2880648 RepID=UPI001CF2E667|nr:hypothetical protein [Clostridium sp. CS001]MCB2289407.1 hypothetical protein [Clostridium sp. CS001]
MNELYDINLFQEKVSFQNKQCSVMLQFYIQISSDSNFRLILFKTGEKKEIRSTDIYYLVGADTDHHTFTPINIKCISEILDIIKKLNINEKIKEVFRDINTDIKTNDVSTTLLLITTHLFVFIGNSDYLSDKNSIVISCLDDNKVTPTIFCSYASDGINLKVYAELSQLPFKPYSTYHLLDGLKVFKNSKFIGDYYPDTLTNDNGKTQLMCRVFNNTLLQDTNLSKFHFDKLSVFDMMYFTTRMAGLKDDSIKLPAEYIQNNNWYTVIIPISNISALSEFGIGNVRFLKHSNLELNEFENHINDSVITRKCYAKVYINEYNFYNAYIKAKKQIEQGIDVLVNIARDDSIYSNHSVATQIIEKDLTYLAAKPIIDTWCYIENSFYEQKIIFNSNSIAIKPELIISNSTVYVNLKVPHHSN